MTKGSMMLGVGVAIALAACGKAQEAATEKTMEKMIESQIAKDGTQAKVDLSQSGFKVSTTDASGKVTQMEMGSAKVSEADVDLPFYPGTKPVEGQATRYTTPDGSMVSVMLHTDDAADKVAGFYRDQLKAKSAGKQFTEMSGSDDNFSFSLSDEKSKSATQVSITKAEKGTDVQIMANRGKQ
jgi:hypothetical protein